MKRYLYACAMCQSMFCAIPCPWKVWEEKARPLILLFLPVVGLEIGLLWAGLAWLCRWLALPPLVAGLLLSGYPYLVTGFLHLDGFMDVTDAVRSWRDLEKRREILKDSHVGSFAVIGVVLLLLAGFALLSSGTGDFRILIFVPIVSRCCSALAVTVLRPMNTSQYAGSFREGISKAQPIAFSVILVLAVAGGFLICGKYGFALLGGIAGHALALNRGFRSLKGMNGDISGYALTLSELAAVAVYTLL